MSDFLNALYDTHRAFSEIALVKWFCFYSHTLTIYGVFYLYQDSEQSKQQAQYNQNCMMHVILGVSNH